MIICSVARRLRLRSWFRKLFHNPSTSFPQADILLKLDAQTHSLGEINHAFEILRRDVVDFEERTSRKLDRYRKWTSERKGGKFAEQALDDAGHATNDSQSVPGDTHEKIAAAALKQGLIS